MEGTNSDFLIDCSSFVGFKKAAEEDFFSKGVVKVKTERLRFIDAGEYAIEVANWTAIGEEDAVIYEGK